MADSGSAGVEVGVAVDMTTVGSITGPGSNVGVGDGIGVCVGVGLAVAVGDGSGVGLDTTGAVGAWPEQATSRSSATVGSARNLKATP